MFLFKKSLVILVLAASFLLFSCSEPGDSEFYGMWLDGKWYTQYDGYIIKMDELTLEYDDGGYGFDWKGDIGGVVLFNTNGTAGVILIEFTKKPVDFDTQAEPAGDFSAVYFRNMTATGMELANVAEIDGGNTITSTANTLTAAKSKYTAGAVGNFVSFWAACEKR